MSISGIARYMPSICAAATMLAACTGSQPPLSPSRAGSALQRPPVRTAYRVLHNFGGSGDGTNPYAGLIENNGTLYGTTANGGASNAGTVFAITEAGKEDVLHSFGSSGDGSNPYAGLVKVNGALYGTTAYGGTYASGTVFAVEKPGKRSDGESVLHSFGGLGDGANPVAALLSVGDMLYGTTIDGGTYGSGAYGSGTVFSITTSGTETVLHSFGLTSGDGVYPYASLLGVKSTFYGTTEYGGVYGSYGAGTIFAIKRSGKETVLHSFGGSGDGDQPLAGVIHVNGMIYGTTSGGGAACGSSGGCGTVFKITRSGAETVFYNFRGGPRDGYDPVAGLIDVNGTLYGTTAAGGATNNGTVFAITKSGEETVLHSFKGGPRDGSSPRASLLEVDGALYGTTAYGGANGDGTVFSLSP